jgi:hypothetical protein
LEACVFNEILVAGAVLAPGKRTVTQVLRVMGLGEEPQQRSRMRGCARSPTSAQSMRRSRRFPEPDVQCA